MVRSVRIDEPDVRDTRRRVERQLQRAVVRRGARRQDLGAPRGDDAERIVVRQLGVEVRTPAGEVGHGEAIAGEAHLELLPDPPAVTAELADRSD
jgi:hypothetical protein